MSRKRLLALAALSAIIAPAFAGTGALAAPADDSEVRVLVFGKTTAFRHDSIPAGEAAIQKLGQENGFAVDVTEDAAQFTDANLAKYQTVVFMSTTGDPLGQPEQKAAFERYIRNGGGFVGVHAAGDSGYSWAWYGGLVGAYFRNHPAQQNATVKMVGQGAASNRGLPNRWNRWDEWYNYRTNPRDAGVRVLAELDEKSYNPGSGAMGDHPIAWCHNYDGGRSWYTGMGHTKESFSDPLFLKHLLGGIQMTAGVTNFPCDPHGD